MNATLAANLWPAIRANWLHQLLLAVAGSLLLAVSAHIQVPFWPVPLTMQTLAVLLIGIAFGPELGAATVLLYLAEGAAGLPVFARGGGIAYFAGPTTGYLISYPIAAAVVGWMTSARRGRSFGFALVGCIAAELIIMLLGFGWLSAFIGASKAWFGGVQPFLVGDGVKLLVAALISQTAWRQVGR